LYCTNALEMFKKDSECKLTYLEGFNDLSLKYLQNHDPLEIPSEILVVSFAKDGDHNRSEISRPFDIWSQMEKNFIKMYQSKKLMGDDGSTRFFAVFKKRMLIQKDREIINLENENPLFDQMSFKNYF
jgi:hypothetical protein